MTPGGLPHSGIPGSTPADGSPRHIAAIHALHRLVAPRHPPCALTSSAPRDAPSRANKIELNQSDATLDRQPRMHTLNIIRLLRFTAFAPLLPRGSPCPRATKNRPASGGSVTAQG